MDIKPFASLSLTHDQALVLFELISREDANESFRTVHLAEQQVIWEIEGQLERILTEPLLPNYTELIASARERLTSE